MKNAYHPSGPQKFLKSFLTQSCGNTSSWLGWPSSTNGLSVNKRKRITWISRVDFSTDEEDERKLYVCLGTRQCIFGLVPRLRMLRICEYRSSTYSRDLKECMPNGRIHQLAIAKIAQKYLAVPASSAPSELFVFHN